MRRPSPVVVKERHHGGGSDERDPKRPRFDDAIEEKLAIIRGVVGTLHGRTAESCAVLQSICTGALGPGMDERDEDQKQCVMMLGRAMSEVKGRLLRDAEMLDEFRVNPEKAKAEIESTLHQYQEGVAVSEKQVAINHKALRECKAALGGANSMLEAAIAAHVKAKKEIRAKEAELEELQQKSADHFMPIKLGSWRSDQEKAKHVTELLPVFMRFDCEQSLIAGFQKAADRKPDGRGHFDQLTIQAAEKDFAAGIHRFEVAIDALKQVVAQAEDGVRSTDDSREKAAQKEREAAIELGMTIRERRENQLCKDEAQKALDGFPRDEKALLQMLEASKQSMKEFSDGPLQAFLCLRDRVAALSL